jgi:hypothetical protein
MIESTESSAEITIFGGIDVEFRLKPTMSVHSLELDCTFERPAREMPDRKWIVCRKIRQTLHPTTESKFCEKSAFWRFSGHSVKL